ncbi:rod shape-determining protein [Spirillospora sp. NPDC127200]
MPPSSTPGAGPSAEARSGPRAALDLGTSRIRVGVPDHDLVIDRPSVLHSCPHGPAHGPAHHGPARHRLAHHGACPDLDHPVRHGMVADTFGCARLTRRTLEEAALADPPREILLAVPVAAGAADVRRAVTAVRSAADCPVRTVEAPLAAALGAGRKITDLRPRLVLDIGAGISELALVTGGRVSRACSVQYTLERPAGHRGPRLPEHVRERLAAELQHMFDGLTSRQRAHVRAQGVLLTGGGALLPSLPGRLSHRTGLAVTVARDPARAILRGLGRLCLSPAVLATAPASRVR